MSLHNLVIFVRTT